jgi:hypothetical protein
MRTIFAGDLDSFLKDHPFKSSIEKWSLLTGDQGLRAIEEERDALEPALRVFDTILSTAEKAHKQVNGMTFHTTKRVDCIHSESMENIAFWNAKALSEQDKKKAHEFVIQLTHTVKNFNKKFNFCYEHACMDFYSTHQEQLNKQHSKLIALYAQGKHMFGYAQFIAKQRAHELATLEN